MFKRYPIDARVLVPMLAAASLVAACGAASAASAVQKECAAKYQAAKAANMLNGQTYRQYYKQCSAEAKAENSAAPASTPVPTSSPTAAPDCPEGRRPSAARRCSRRPDYHRCGADCPGGSHEEGRRSERTGRGRERHLPDRRGRRVRQGNTWQGALPHLPGAVSRQQGEQRERRFGLARQGRLLQPVQHASQGLTARSSPGSPAVMAVPALDTSMPRVACSRCPSRASRAS